MSVSICIAWSKLHYTPTGLLCLAERKKGLGGVAGLGCVCVGGGGGGGRYARRGLGRG